MIGGLPIQIAGVNTAVLSVASGLEPETTAWLSSVAANSGTVSNSTRNAINTFVVSAKSSGYFTKLKLLWIPVGDYAASAVCIVHPNANRLVTRVNFASGDYSESTGYQGGGTKYINFNATARAISVATQTGIFGCYSHSSAAVDGASFGAMTANDSAAVVIWPRWTDDKFYAYAWDLDDTAGGGQSFSNTNPAGLLVLNRSSTSNCVISRNTTTLNTNTRTITSTTPTVNLFGFCYNNNGTPTEYSNRRYSMFFGGESLTSGELSAFWTHLQTLYAAIGRSL